MAPGHDHPGRGQTHGLITGDNIIVNGGNLTSIHNMYCSPPPSQQVLDILYPQVGPPRIDGRLLHNSKAYEIFRRSCSNPESRERMIYELADACAANNSILRRDWYHVFRRHYSRAIALGLAQRLAGQSILLASIILHTPSQSCTQYIVPTLAYQLIQNIPSSAEHILAAIRYDPCIFERDTGTQFKQLVERPLKLASKQASLEELAKWPSVIVVDGNANQFSPGSAPQQVVQLVGNLLADDSLDIRLSLVLTSSTTVFDRTMIITLALQQSAGGTACYFTWRIYG
ncbi:hypothetical protein D9619_006518 [Psilocybe cf. subviscida]|uniref:Uncharacterized protein n=1 Tax=Psilocybe cf. subviscida TaxID=2480587 RepID=A0A8H5EXW8_9AGAR|nr:hypothetical protein D9619_006518 [Psilocybe cf. subviscida]